MVGKEIKNFLNLTFFPIEKDGLWKHLMTLCASGIERRVASLINIEQEKNRLDRFLFEKKYRKT